MCELAPLHPTFPRETTPIGTALDVERIAAQVTASRAGLPASLNDVASDVKVTGAIAAAKARRAEPEPFAARVCGRCGATGKQPCVTASGKVMRRFHVARG